MAPQWTLDYEEQRIYMLPVPEGVPGGAATPAKPAKPSK